MKQSASARTGDGGSVRELIAALDRILVSVPQAASDVSKRSVAIRNIVRLLQDRGVDGESLIRYGMTQRAYSPILIAVFAGENAPIVLDFVNGDAWRKLLHIEAPDARSRTDRRDVAVAEHRLAQWVRTASLEDLLCWTPPEETAWSQIVLDEPTHSDVLAPYAWLWQRNVVDDLDRWTTPALHLEYRWIHMEQSGVFSDSVLGSAAPDASLLDSVIARRAVEPADVSDAEATLWAMQDQATEYLKQGRYAEASALFEFHHRRYPDDPRAVNNLGFCLLPIRSTDALYWLTHARESGFADGFLNSYNQCCCLEDLNRDAEALDKAEHAWQRERAGAAHAATVWVRDPEAPAGWTISGDRDPHHALAELGLRVAERMGLEDRAVRWRDRVTEANGRGRE